MAYESNTVDTDLLDIEANESGTRRVKVRKCVDKNDSHKVDFDIRNFYLNKESGEYVASHKGIRVNAEVAAEVIECIRKELAL